MYSTAIFRNPDLLITLPHWTLKCTRGCDTKKELNVARYIFILLPHTAATRVMLQINVWRVCQNREISDFLAVANNSNSFISLCHNLTQHLHVHPIFNWRSGSWYLVQNKCFQLKLLKICNSSHKYLVLIHAGKSELWWLKCISVVTPRESSPIRPI